LKSDLNGVFLSDEDMDGIFAHHRYLPLLIEAQLLPEEQDFGT